MHRFARRSRTRSRKGTLGFAGWMVVALCAAAPASATQVFHSPNDDGQPAGGTPTIASGGVQSVFLYVDGGASASAVDTACDTGTGSEVCGYTLTLTGLTGLTLVGFTPDGAPTCYTTSLRWSSASTGWTAWHPPLGPNASAN